MMKLTVAFLAALAAVDASNAHGRRHVRRQQYGQYGHYQPGPALNSTSSAAPSSANDAAASSTPSASASTSGPTGGYPVGTGSVGSSVASSTASIKSDALPTFPGTGTVSFASTGAPTSFPVTGSANSTGLPDMVTSTIYSTQIFTLPGCPPTVHDCPAESTKLITSVVPVATTVCPKGSLTPEATPSGTGAPTGLTVVPETTSVSEITHTVTSTYVYTVGPSKSAHAVTTEVVQTSTETIYKTIYVTKPIAGVTPEATGYSPQSTGSPVESDTTTTISSTSTTTKYITVYPSSAGSPIPTGAGGEGEGQCAPPVTVTVTAQETVTVTAGHDTYNTVSVGGEDETTGLPTGTAIPTYTSAPYPLSNSTSVYPGSTGFVTYTAPSGTAGATGGFSYPVASGTGAPSLPVFSLVPESTGVAPVGTSTATPTPSSGGYGGYYRRFF